MNTADIAVLRFGERRVPRPLTGPDTRQINEPTEVDAVIGAYRRLVVVGCDADLATVLTRLLRAERLDIEVGYAPNHRAARRARHGTAQRVPLIRDETGRVIVGAARWLPSSEAEFVHGEAVVDDTVLFDGDVAGVRIEPTWTQPGLRAAITSPRGRPGRWVTGRAAQLGTTDARLVRDGVPAARPVKRSTFYRHIEGWLLVR